MKSGAVAEQIEPQNRIKTSVRHKGIAFLTVAVILVAVFFFQLFQVTLKAERLATMEASLSDVVGLADECLLECADGWREISSMLFSSQFSAKVDPERFRKRTSELFAQLQPHVSGYTGAEKLLQESQLLAADEYQVLLSLKTKSNATRSLAETMSIINSFSAKHNLGQRLLEVRLELDQQRASIAGARQEEQLTRQQVKEQVIGGAIAAILFFVVIAVAFLNDITQRLSVLVGNAQQIPTGKMLPAKVSGTDELAYLDEVLHQASAQLLKSAEYRKSLMEMIAHDLRSPLTASRLTLQLLLDSAQNQGPIDPEKIKSVRDNLVKIISLVENLLTIDKLEAGELTLDPEWIDIKDVVDESIGVLSSLAAVRNLTIINEVPKEYVEADKLRITQVLINLLTNAIKFSHQSGRVRVCSELQPKLLRIMVLDEGVGLQPEDHNKLFKKFFQADNQDEDRGFGLGLAITKLIIEAHGGQVGMSSVPREGSTFWFTLPMDEVSQDHTLES